MPTNIVINYIVLVDKSSYTRKEFAVPCYIPLYALI